MVNNKINKILMNIFINKMNNKKILKKTNIFIGGRITNKNLMIFLRKMNTVNITREISFLES